MAFRFNWPEFDHDFYVEAKSQLETAMNKGNKPPVIVDHITVKELNMGTQAPELEILEIGELANDKFRGIFKLKYAGDAYIEIKTKVQANPMHAKATSQLPRHSRPGVLAADQPLVVPMILRISDLKLRGIVVLVVSKTKGVTLVFKNDPLESIRVSSTFDCVSILRDFLQRQIEAQLRNMLQEDLPVMIHNLSIKFIQLEEEKKRKREQEGRRLKLIAAQQQQQQAEAERLSVFSSERQLRRAFSSASSPTFMRVRSNTFCSDLSLPELDLSCDSSLYTPSLVTDDYIDDYLTIAGSPTIMTPTTVFSDSNSYYHLESTNKKMSAPMTVANLFTHNRQFMTPQLGHAVRIPSPQEEEDYMTAEKDYLFKEQQSELTAFPFPKQQLQDSVIDDTYCHFFTEDDDDGNSTIILKPVENRMVRQLSQLTSVNYTLSPLTDTISHFTFRSLPHKKSLNTNASSNTSSACLRHKKVPKRRVTRLNISVPRL
ncbi:MAG: hypothetical protein EXX96DRAFT_569290 [Benjaminiella poitrasii]|nr:MAG: hypothetical protein EXX96DRAFT_569290 [Benjaminiella poitrasii]